MKKLTKQAAALLAAATLLLSLSACGTGEKEIKTLFNGGVEVQDNSTGAKVREGRILELPTMYYQQYGADPALGDNAALASEGWKKTDLPLNADKTAIVVMHAAYVGEPENSPDQFQYCEYVPRSYRLARENFARVLDAARAAGVKIYHVPFGAGFYEEMPGYTETKALGAEESPSVKKYSEFDDVYLELHEFRGKNVAPGPNGWAPITEARKKYMNFLPEAVPQGKEPIAQTSNELAEVAKRDGVNHLIYMGFAVDACLLSDECGMLGMSARRFMCSAIMDCVTAVERKESVQSLHATETALWRVSYEYGYVYESKDIADAFGLIKK